MLDVGDALRREQAREDVAVLAGLAGGERRERADRQAEVEADAVEMAGANAGAGQDEQAMLRQQRAQLVDERQDRFGTAVHDQRPPIFTTCSQGSSWIGRSPATGRVRSRSSRVWRASGEATCLIWSVVSHDGGLLSSR